MLPTKLNIAAWESYLAGYDDTLLDYIKFGFPMGYVGPASDTTSLPNHPSAVQFPDQVDLFIEKEMSLGGRWPIQANPLCGIMSRVPTHDQAKV